MTRKCGSCSLCCTLLPMKREKTPDFAVVVEKMIANGMTTRKEMGRMIRDFDKPAGQDCQYQKRSIHGCCSIYSRRPFGCHFWSCRWLRNDDTDNLKRPDSSHYVIDVMDDFVVHEDDGKQVNIPVIQVWVDPLYRHAHRDPALRDYLARRGEEGFAALIRYSESEGFVLFPPALAGGKWVEHEPQQAARGEHTIEEKLAVLGDVRIEL